MKMMTAVVIFFVGFMILIGFAAKNTIEENDQIRNGCKLTDFYVIGNRGRATPVYDCKGIR